MKPKTIAIILGMFFIAFLAILSLFGILHSFKLNSQLDTACENVIGIGYEYKTSKIVIINNYQDTAKTTEGLLIECKPKKEYKRDVEPIVVTAFLVGSNKVPSIRQ